MKVVVAHGKASWMEEVLEKMEASSRVIPLLHKYPVRTDTEEMWEEGKVMLGFDAEERLIRSCRTILPSKVVWGSRYPQHDTTSAHDAIAMLRGRRRAGGDHRAHDGRQCGRAIRRPVARTCRHLRTTHAGRASPSHGRDENKIARRAPRAPMSQLAVTPEAQGRDRAGRIGHRSKADGDRSFVSSAGYCLYQGSIRSSLRRSADHSSLAVSLLLPLPEQLLALS